MKQPNMFKKMLKTAQKTEGFSIIEVVLVIAVIALFANLGTPDISAYLNIKKEQDERLSLQDVEKAITSRVKADGHLFDATTIQDVADELEASSNRDKREVLQDTWKYDRYIITLTESEFISGDVLDVKSLIIYSFGFDNCPGELATCTETNRQNHIAALKTKLTDLNASGGSATAALDTKGDFYIYVSDREERVSRYKEALERLDRLGKALDEYAKLRLNENLALKTPGAADLTHYPPSLYSGDLTGYANKVRADTTTALAKVGIGGTQIYNGIPGVKTPTAAQVSLDMFRARQGMLALTQILGLPVSNCCSGLETFTHAGEEYEAPFYYYSRPGRRVISTGNCFYKQNIPATISVAKRPYCWGEGMPN